jgi:hypothetical protein
MAGNQTANFVVKAKDQATGPLGKIGTSLGKLKGTSVSVFKGIAAASAVAATALAAFAFKAIDSAIKDEQATIRLNAALKARGILTDGLKEKIDQQIVSMAALGITDDQVRAGIEMSSRFFTKQNDLLRLNAVAADVAAITGGELVDVITAIAKGQRGQTRGLVALGIQVKKGATLNDILTAATKKYGGAAEELATSTSGKLLSAQVRFNEAIEAFGYKFLPKVQEGLTLVVEQGLPAFESALDNIAPKLISVAENQVIPLFESFDKLTKSIGFTGGAFELLGAVVQLALMPVVILLDALKLVIDGITAGIRFITGQGPMGTGVSPNPMASKYSTAGNVGTSYGAPGNTTFVTNVAIGTTKVDTVVSNSLNRTVTPKRGR